MGLLSDILSPKHRKIARQTKIFLDIFQTSQDRRLYAMARRMRDEGLVSQAFASTNALTYVRPNDSRKKVRIYDEDDLKKFAGGRDLNDFDDSHYVSGLNVNKFENLCCFPIETKFHSNFSISESSTIWDVIFFKKKNQ